eukprot:scaffold2537_cov78-Skeletonema_marinoi.AAC.1
MVGRIGVALDFFYLLVKCLHRLTIYQMGRAAWSRFALLRGGKSGSATRALGAVSAISFGWKVLHIIDMVPPIKLLCNNEDTV